MLEEESTILSRPEFAASKTISDFFRKIRLAFSIILQIIKLPVVQLKFELKINPVNIQRTYEYFTKPHPVYKVFKNKSVGAELISLQSFQTRNCYIESVKAKDRAWRYAKRAKARKYVFVEIDRNDYVEDIHEINTSMTFRQGREMDSAYLMKVDQYEDLSNFKYFGVLNNEGKLVAYCNVGLYGNFYSIERIIGYRNNDGVMHFLVVEMICRIIEGGIGDYLMYDTYFGASSSMKLFKEMFGFSPYRVRFSIQ
ncbi:MAG TPA: hypothetical protein VNX68_02040 [Nitrosopumilaceae archaeon]|nr:hypothetical protein [Nitrosopumilaceae archaeon]